MDSTLKQRLIGAAVLAALAIIFLPMLLKGPDVREPDAAEVPLSMPAMPSQDFETRELPLTVPDAATPPGGALGMAPGSTPPTTPEQSLPDSAVAEVAPPNASDASGAAGATSIPAPTTPVTPVPVKSAIVEAPLPPAEAARVGAGRHVVNVGSFANLTNANSLAAKLRGAGLPVIAERVSLNGGTAMRLRVGPYATRASAEAARLRADQATGTRSTVIVLDAPPASSTPATESVPVAAPITVPAKAPAAAAPATATPAPAGSGFAVQLSAPNVEADAIALRDKARAAGFSSFVQRIETASGTRFRVRVGPVADRSAAASLREEVNSKLGTGGIVVTNP